MKKTKQISCMVLALLLVVNLFCAEFTLQVHAEGTDIAQGTCGDNITWVLDNDGVLTVRGIGNMAESPSWLDYDDSIKKAVIEEGITSIGKKAFYYCKNLAEISIPMGVTTIESSAFYECDSLLKVHLPKSVTCIDWNAFSWCDKLNEIVIPESVTDIDDGAIGYSYKVVIYGKAGSAAEDYAKKKGFAFWEIVEGLESISVQTMPTKVLYEVGESMDISGLSLKLHFEDDTTSTLTNGFEITGYDSTSAGTKTITVRYERQTTTFDVSIIQPTEYMAKGTCGDNLSWILSNEGVLTISGSGEMANEPNWTQFQSKIKKIVIESGIASIAETAFESHYYVTEVVIPESVTQIGEKAFKHCFDLETVSIPSGVTSIKEYTFNGCAIKQIIVPDGVTSIGKYAFCSCDELEAATIPNSVTSIESSAFSTGKKLIIFGYADSMAEMYARNNGIPFEMLVQGLESIAIETLPSKMTYDLGESLDTTGLTIKLFFSDGTTTTLTSGYSASGFESKTVGTKKVTIRYERQTVTCEVKVIQPTAYKARGTCGNLTWILDNDGVLTVSGYGDMPEELTWEPFKSYIKKVNIEEGVTSIAARAFYSYYYLTEATIANSVETMGNYTFASCSKLASVNIPSQLTNIPYEAFDSCRALSEVRIPEGVVSIEAYAFAHCSELTTIIVPQSVTSIHGDALKYSSKLAIHGYANTAAQIYANEYEIPFVDLENLVVTEVSAELLKDTYFVGDSFSVNDLVVTATYNDGSQKTVTAYTISGFDSTTAGEKNVTVTYEGETATVVVMIMNPTIGLSLTDTTLNVNEQITLLTTTTPDAMNVTWSSNNSGVASVSEGVITAHAEGVASITAQFTYKGTCYSATCTVTVEEIPIVLESISIDAHPNKRTFYLGDKLDTSGLRLKLTFSDGHVEYVTEGFAVSGFDSDAVGTKALTVTYEGKTTTYTVTVDVPRITLSKTSVTLTEGESAAIIASTSPSNVTVSWSSNNTDVVTVSGGQIIAKEPGTASVIARFIYNNVSYSKSCSVTVEKKEVLLISISVGTMPDKKTYYIGDVLETNGMQLKLAYSDGSSAYMTSGFSVSGFSSNTTGVKTVTVTYEGKTTTFSVTVYKPKVVLDENDLTIKEGGTATLSAEIEPGDMSVTWISDNAKVATVSKGKITAIAGGKATITARLTYNGKVYSDSCVVTVPKSVGTLTGLKASLYGYDDIKLSWSSAKNATHYKVYYKKSSDSKYSYLGQTTKNSYTKANLSDGVKYSFEVVPYCISGKESIKGTASTASLYTLKKIGTPKIEKVTSSMVKVRWKNISGESGYQISQSTSKSKSKIVSTYTTTTAAFKSISAKKGKTYYYKVRAYKTEGSKKIYGPWSSVKSYKLPSSNPSVATKNQGKYMYFVEGSRIRRLDTNSGAVKLIYDSEYNISSSVSYYKDYLYFSIRHGSSGPQYVCRVKTSGKSYKVLDGGHSPVICGGKIYYHKEKYNHKTFALARYGIAVMKTDGSGKKVLVKGTDSKYYSDLRIADGRMYYRMNQYPLSDTFKSASLTGTDVKGVSLPADSENLRIVGDKIYYTKWNRNTAGYDLYYYSLSNEKASSVVAMTGMGAYEFNAGNLYYISGDVIGSTWIYKYNFSTKKTTKLATVKRGDGLDIGKGKYMILYQNKDMVEGDMTTDVSARITKSGTGYKQLYKWYTS